MIDARAIVRIALVAPETAAEVVDHLELVAVASDLEAHLLERLAHDRDEYVDHHEGHDHRIDDEQDGPERVLGAHFEIRVEFADETLETGGERFHGRPVRLDLVREEEIEHLHERHPHEHEHQAEAEQLGDAVAEGERERVDLLVEAEELQELERREDTASAECDREHLVPERGYLQLHVTVAARLLEEAEYGVGLRETVEEETERDPRAHDE